METFFFYRNCNITLECHYHMTNWYTPFIHLIGGLNSLTVVFHSCTIAEGTVWRSETVKTDSCLKNRFLGLNI